MRKQKGDKNLVYKDFIVMIQEKDQRFQIMMMSKGGAIGGPIIVRFDAIKNEAWINNVPNVRITQGWKG